MRPSPSTFPRALALAVLGAAALFSSRASAQSCCAGTTATVPGRLAVYEDALVALQARVGGGYGSHDVNGSYVANPPGVSELDFEQDLIGTYRVAHRVEVSALVPFIETRRKAGGYVDTGGGLGDAVASVRWDVIRAHEKAWIPGISLVAALTLPTGRPPDRATHVLAADATGTGAFRGAAGVLLDQTLGHVFFSGGATFGESAPRTIAGATTHLGLQVSVFGATGWAFEDESAVGVILTRFVEARATREGVTDESSGRSFTTLGLFGSHPFSDTFRMLGSVVATPPFDGFGRNQVAAFTASVMGARTW